MVNYDLISRIIRQPDWNPIDVNIDEETMKFLQNFIMEYDSKVNILLRDGNDKEKIMACKELMNLFEEPLSLLYMHLSYCLNSKEQYLEDKIHTLIEDVFKLKMYKQLET